MIRNATPRDRDAVVAAMVRYVRATPYGRVLIEPEAHAPQLFDASLETGLCLVDYAGDVLVGCIVLLVNPLMGQVVAEEIGWWHESPRGLLELARVAERQAVQKGVTVLKMSAPAWTDLGQFYRRQGFEELETVWTKVLTNGLDERGHRGSRPRRGLPVIASEEDQRGRP